MGQVNWQSLGLLWLRLITGIAIATHGYQKIFVRGVDGFAQGVGEMGFPAPLFFAWMAVLSEFVGGCCMALGLATRWAALFVCLTMSVALFIRHGSDPFSVKELALLYWAASGALMFAGGGRFSVDEIIGRWRARGTY